MTTTRLVPVLALVALVLALAPLLAVRPAGASGLLTVEVVAPAGSGTPGSPLAVTVRALGEDAELAPLEYAVEGGAIQGTLSLSRVEPGIAEATVFVARETAGEATLSVRMAGTVVASRTFQFGQAAPIRIEVALVNGPAASARTWRFEIVDAAGAVADTVEVSMSGDQPRATTASRDLPFGQYTVRQLLGSDTATVCDGAAFYATDGANVPVTHAAGGGAAVVTVTVCDEAPDELGVSIPVDPVAPAPSPSVDVPGSINEVRGVRIGGDEPLPPATGSGTAQDAAAAPANSVSLVAALALLALCAPGAVLAVRSVPGRREQ
ncbi:MAG: hypothetical protein IT303_20165 [Dehalococcoidia bacterium]|nr:hypothetical protein [Dehalococcoidia bacterium]